MTEERNKTYHKGIERVRARRPCTPGQKPEGGRRGLKHEPSHATQFPLRTLRAA